MFLSAAALLGSCNMDDFFELKRPEATPWLSVDELELSVINPYWAFSTGMGWNSAAGLMAFVNEMASDITYANPFAGYEQDGIVYYTRNFPGSSDPEEMQLRGTWAGFYTVITGCNAPLTYIEEREEAGQPVFENMTEADRQTLRRQKGELYFMCGFAHWHIAHLFLPPYNPGGDNTTVKVPLKDKFIATADDMRAPYMGTTEEVYQLMLADFKKAKEYLPEKYRQRGLPGQYAASAMLMRVNWLMGNTRDALTECNQIIEYAERTGDYSLEEEPIRAFNRNTESKYTANPVAKEVLFELAFDENSKNVGIPFARMSKSGAYGMRSKPGLFDPADANWTGGLRAFDETSTYYSHGSWACGYWNPNIVYYIGWAATNDPMDLTNYVPTEEALKDKRFTQLHCLLKPADQNYYNTLSGSEQFEYETTHETTSFGVKWNAFWSDKYYRAPDSKFSNVPLIRLAEVYLTRASLNESTRTSDVNKVRTRAGLNSLTYATEEDVEKERIKELAFEAGDRSYFLIIHKRTIDGGKRAPVGGSFTNPMTDGVAIDPLYPPYSNYYTTMPYTERDYSASEY